MTFLVVDSVDSLKDISFEKYYSEISPDICLKST